MANESKPAQPAPANLRKDPEKVLELIKEIGQQERHFNQSIDRYKTMASTWLLAVFGAIGFVLANKIEPWLLFTAGIGLAGGIGILLLWIIDIRVYQQLLAAAFIEGLKLEEENTWLPRTRHNMVSSQEAGSVTMNLSWFYILGVSAPLLIFNYALASYILVTFGFSMALITVLIGGALLFFLIDKIRFTSQEESLRKKYVRKVDPEEEALLRRNTVLIASPVYLVIFGLININTLFTSDTPALQQTHLQKAYDRPALDGSTIRLLPATGQGRLAYCTLPPAGVSKTIQYKTTEEIWYIIKGEGELWRQYNDDEDTAKLTPGTSVTIPTHTSYQFRNTAKKDSLKILIMAMPSWPGEDDFVRVEDHWGVK